MSIPDPARTREGHAEPAAAGRPRPAAEGRPSAGPTAGPVSDPGPQLKSSKGDVLPLISDVQQRIDGASDAERVKEVRQVFHGLRGTENVPWESAIKAAETFLTELTNRTGKTPRTFRAAKLACVEDESVGICANPTERPP